MIFDKSEKELYEMLPTFQKMEIDLTEIDKSYELPLVVFAVGGDGRGLLIDVLNIGELWHGVCDMVEEEFEERDEWDLKPGIYQAHFNWFTAKDEYTGEYDCDLVVNDLKTIFDYEEYKRMSDNIYLEE